MGIGVRHGFLSGTAAREGAEPTSSALEPPDTTWTAIIVPAGEPGDPLVVSGHVFAPNGQHTVAGVVVYAYNTDKDGYYSPDGKVGHPRIKGYMKTDAEGRFELHTVRPGRYPGMHIPAHVHFNLWGAGYPVQWMEELRFAGDSYLTEAMKNESQALGKFRKIRPLSGDKDGVYHCEINLRLQEKSNYSGTERLCSRADAVGLFHSVGRNSDYAVTRGAIPTACACFGSEIGRNLFFLCSRAAPMNAANSGCGSSGFDLNSGWNWQPRNHGWSGASTIST